MRASDPDFSSRDGLLKRPMIVTPCRAIVLSFLFVSLALSPACGGPASRGGGQPGASATSIEIPEITEEIIYERINDTRVRDVPEETGAGQPTYWNFDEHEPKEIKVVDKQMNGARATLVLDIKTESAPGARIHRKLAGQIRTEWRLEA